MKKSVIIFSIFLLLAVSMNSITSIAQTNTFSEGFYDIEDLKLSPNVSYNVQNVSPNKALMIVIDENQMIQQVLRFEGNSKQYVIIPLQYGYRIVIIGTGKLSFTT